MCVLQQESELEKLLQVEKDNRELVQDMRQKVEEAKSSLSSNRSRGKVLDALMNQKSSGRIPGILGRLVGPQTHAHRHSLTHSLTLRHVHAETDTHNPSYITIASKLLSWCVYKLWV